MEQNKQIREKEPKEKHKKYIQVQRYTGNP